MTIAIIGTGGIGSVVARQLASGGETCGSRAPTIGRHKCAYALEAEVGVVNDHPR